VRKYWVRVPWTMLHHKNPESNDSGFFAWAGQDENSTATPQA